MTPTIASIVELSPKVIKYIAKSKYAENDFGQKMVEIVIRNAKGKFVSFQKCLLSNVTQNIQQDLANKSLDIIKTSVTMVSKSVATNLAVSSITMVSSLANNVQTEMVRRAVKEVGRDVKKVLSGMRMLTGMNFVTMGLTTANIGISAAGFYIMNKKLDSLKAKVDTIGTKVDSIHKMNVDMLVTKPTNEIIVASKLITDKLISEQKVSKEELDSFLQMICSNVPLFLTMGDKMPIEDLLEVFYQILPIAVNMMSLYYAEYYDDQNGRKHPLHDSLASVLKQACGDLLCSQIEDYYFLQKGLHGSTVDVIIDQHKMICNDLVNRLEDTYKLRSGCMTKEDYEELCSLTDQMAAAMAAELIPVMEKEYSQEQTAEYINQASMQAFGQQVAAVGA